MADNPFASLIKYSDARKALSEVRRVDEVKSIRDKAMAMQLYAQQAKDTFLIDHATDIRLRAEMRAGELLLDMEKAQGTRGDIIGSKPGPRGNGKKGLSGGSLKKPPDKSRPTLAELGVTKSQSSRWQRMATLSDVEREDKIEQAKAKAQGALEGLGRERVPRNTNGRVRANGDLAVSRLAEVLYLTMVQESEDAADLAGWDKLEENDKQFYRVCILAVLHETAMVKAALKFGSASDA